jgi:hypothetical protein
VPRGALLSLIPDEGGRALVSRPKLKDKPCRGGEARRRLLDGIPAFIPPVEMGDCRDLDSMVLPRPGTPEFRFSKEIAEDV